MMAVLGAPWVPGCDPAGPAEPSSSDPRRANIVEPVPASPPVRRGKLIAGERVERIPQWPAPASIDATTRARLPAAARDALGRSPVPVLVPGEGALLGEAAIFSQASGYALSASHGGITVAIQASKLATLLAHIGNIPGDTEIRGTLGWLGNNDGIRTASWIEHGVAYSLDLECYVPDGPECSEAALRSAVEGLVYVGGAGELQPRGGAK